MAWQQTAVLLVLSLTFPVSEGWERISWPKDASGKRDGDDYSTEGKAVVQVAESPNFLSYASNGFQVPFMDVTKKNRKPVQFMDVAKNRKPSIQPAVLCSEYEFNITLPVGWPLNEVKILGSKGLLSVFDANALVSCGYFLTRGLYQNTLIVPFSGCQSHVRQSHVGLQAGRHILRVLYVDEAGKMDIATVSCEANPKSSQAPMVNLSPDVPQVRSLSTFSSPTTSKCAKSGDVHDHNHDSLTHVHPAPPTHVHQQGCTASPTHVHKAPPTHVHGPPKHPGCSIPKEHQVACGSGDPSSSQCLVMGCCVDSATSDCYYPMDECTMDKQFVFILHHDATPVHVDPTTFVIMGKDECKPIIANDKFAIFQFKVDDCSTRHYHIGETMIYLVEVQTAVKALNLKYGIITRDDPIRVLVECRYPKKEGGKFPSLASVGYMVMSPGPIIPSTFDSEGLFGVELRIAKDETYSTYLTHYHQALKLLLGKPVYLEVRLKSAVPHAVILVNYCLAYPRSATNALVLVHEGCANPLDPSVSILKVDDLPQNRHQRRFVVTAFQFMDQKTNQYLDEEIYFMCSTEVCMPAEKTCEERCFDGKL